MTAATLSAPIKLSSNITAYEVYKHFSISGFKQADQDIVYDIASPGEFLLVTSAGRDMRLVVMPEDDLRRIFNYKGVMK
jgi:hypothetical protein